MPALRDLTGQRFGLRTAIERVNVPERASGRRAKQVFWKVLCDCGTEQVTSGRDLIKNKSCGCYSREVARKRNLKPPGEANRNNLYTRYQINAAHKGLAFTLSMEECSILWESNCHYCGRPPSQICHNAARRFNGAYIHGGIDRSDNAMGYIQGNCLPCCKWCNYLKRAASYEDFVSHVHKMSDHLRSSR
jgi:hypothetical protein